MLTVSFPVCPNCSRRLRGGWPSFGPEQVLCGYCGTLIITNLESWNDNKSFKTSIAPAWLRKVGLVLTELFFPTWMGYKEVVPRLLLSMAAYAITLGLPIFQVIRLCKMRKETILYEKTNNPPVWKLSTFLGGRK